MKLLTKNPLFFAFFLPDLVDGIVTLVGQDAQYWSGRVVNEASPAYYALLFSPWLFLFGSLVWFGFWYWAMKRLKEPFSFFFVFLFTAGHSWGSSSWLWKIARDNGWYVATDQLSVMLVWGGAVVYFVLIAVFATICLQLYLRKRKKLQPAQG